MTTLMAFAAFFIVGRTMLSSTRMGVITTTVVAILLVTCHKGLTTALFQNFNILYVSCSNSYGRSCNFFSISAAQECNLLKAFQEFVVLAKKIYMFELFVVRFYFQHFQIRNLRIEIATAHYIDQEGYLSMF